MSFTPKDTESKGTPIDAGTKALEGAPSEKAEAKTTANAITTGNMQTNEENKEHADIFYNEIVKEISADNEKLLKQAKTIYKYLITKDDTQGIRDAVKVEDVERLKVAAKTLAKNLDTNYEANAEQKASLLQKARAALQSHQVDTLDVGDKPVREKPTGPRPG